MTSTPKIVQRTSAYAMFTRNSEKKRPLESISDSDEFANIVSEEEQAEVEVPKKPSTIMLVAPMPKKKKSKRDERYGNRSQVTDEFLPEESVTETEKDKAVTNEHNGTSAKPTRGFRIHSAITPISESKKVRKTGGSGNIAADEAFNWLLKPLNADVFFKDIYEKKPYYLRRLNPTYYNGLFSSKEFDEILKENRLQYADHLDVVSYVNGKRMPLIPDSIVHPDFVWNAYHEGNSIRMRNPQAYHRSLWKLCSLLQEYFTSSVGANIYLTPADTQGFPPHFDDIDAFILQVEGKKIWKIYEPRSDDEALPMYSSGDLNEAEIGVPCMEVELSAGDLLYFPRGYIHQAKASFDTHSLHVTVSTNQLNTWGDFLQAGISHALTEAMKSDVEFRKSLPKDYFDYTGGTYSDSNSSERQSFEKKAANLAQKALKHFSVDKAADVRLTDFMHGCIPPVFSKKEKECSIHGNGTQYANGVVFPVQDLTADTKVKWIRKRAFRLVIDEEIRLYYTLGNSRDSKADAAQFMEVDADLVPAVNALFKNYPEFTKVKNLPVECMETKLGFAKEMYYNGFLITSKPLPLESTD